MGWEFGFYISKIRFYLQEDKVLVLCKYWYMFIYMIIFFNRVLIDEFYYYKRERNWVYFSQISEEIQIVMGDYDSIYFSQRLGEGVVDRKLIFQEGESQGQLRLLIIFYM